MLEVQNAEMHYGSAQVLYGVDFTVKTGEVSCLLGRNGVGKTSLLRGITDRHRFSGGSVIWDGQDISKLTATERARLGIAFVPQGREIFSQLTVHENLISGFGVLAPAERFVPDEIFDLFPVLSDMLERRGGDLSGGQQQQLAIARAMVMRPKLLILDEPTEGIQPSIIGDIGHAISFLRDKGDMGILLVEQYFDFAQELADSFAVLEKGAVVASGNRADLTDDIRRFLAV